MLLTEEQARTKWCPMSRYSHVGGDAAANRWKQAPLDGQPHATNPVPCRCIASECMAWRWDKAAGGMVERRVYNGTLDYDGYSAQRFARRGETFFQFDGAWWRYEHSSSDSKGAYDLIVRSQDEGAAVMGGYCGLSGKVES